MTRRGAARTLLLLCIVGLALRVGVILITGGYRINPGAAEHASIARSILLGEGFSFGDFGYFGPTSVQSPTYPLFLTVIFKLLGVATPQAFLAAMCVNALVGTAAIWLTYRLARELGATRAVGVIAAALCAIWPTQVYASNFAQAVTWIIAGVTATMLLFIRATRRGRLRDWLGFSVVGTATALTEPVILPVLMLSGLIVLVWPTLTARQRVRNAAVLLATAIVIIGPWTLRNYWVHGTFVPIKSTFWVNVWKGANDYATGTDRLHMDEAERKRLREQWTELDDSHMRAAGTDQLRQYDMLPPQALRRLYDKTEVQREAVFKELATTWIREHPRRYAELSLIRLGKSLWIDWDNPKSHNLAYVASRAAVLAMTIPGLLLAWRRRWRLFFPLLLVGMCLLTYTLTLTAARFSMPFEPLQFCLGAGVLATLTQTIARRDPSQATSPVTP